MATRAPVVAGRVEISRLPAENPLKARVAAKGFYSASGSSDTAPFHTTFDGSTIRRLRAKEKAVVVKTLDESDPRERQLGFVTSFFGGGPYQLLMLEFLTDSPFDDRIKAPVAEYEGRTAVEGESRRRVSVPSAAGKRDARAPVWV